MNVNHRRNIAREITEGLTKLVERAGKSAAAVVVRARRERSRRADNAALLGDLPDRDVEVADVLADLEAGRAHR